jgi:nucleotide-binding universal stress UspA family protein
MFEKLLVPIDGSELAEVALPYAEELAGRLGSAVVLLQVCELESERTSHERQFYMSRLAEIVERGVREYRMLATRSESEEIGVESVMVVGNPAEEIIDYAETKGIGLIIMATHGRSGIRRWTVGSVADKVLRGTSIPVALIRAGKTRPAVREKGMLTKALLPLDGSEVGEAALPYVEDLAVRLKTEVTILQVVEPKYFVMGAEPWVYTPPYWPEWLESMKESARTYLAGIEQRLKAKGVVASSRIEMGAAAEQIIEVAEQVDADVIAMSTHGRSGIARWALGSVADRVLYYGNIPLLLVRARQDAST